MQMHNHTHIVLLRVNYFLIVRVAEEGQRHTVSAKGRLNDIRDVVLIGLLIKIGHILAGMILMLLEIVIRAVGNAPQLAPAEREQELNVRRGLGVEGKLLLLMVAQTQIFLRHAEGQQPVFAEILPIIEPVEIRAGLAEEFTFHLLELTGTEREVAGRDLVSEALAYLADAEGQLLARGALHILEVNKNSLGCLGTQINFILRILRHTLEGLEHQIELADIGEIGRAAIRAFDIVLADIFTHLLKGHAVRIAAGILNELIGTMARFAVLAVHERIGEAAHMARRHPHLRIHQNRGIQTDIVRAFLHKLLHPRLFDVVFELHAQRSIIPRIGKAAVNFGAGIHEAAVFAESDNFFHCLVRCFHHCSTSMIWLMLFGKNNELAQNIIDKDDKEIDNNLCQQGMHLYNVQTQPHACHVDAERQQPCSEKRNQLKQKQLHREAFAAEHKKLVGKKSENHGQQPGEQVGNLPAPLQRIMANGKHRDIDHRGQHTEHQIRNHLRRCTEAPQFFDCVLQKLLPGVLPADEKQTPGKAREAAGRHCLACKNKARSAKRIQAQPGRGEETRTPDILLPKQARYQLRYTSKDKTESDCSLLYRFSGKKSRKSREIPQNSSCIY